MSIMPFTFLLIFFFLLFCPFHFLLPFFLLIFFCYLLLFFPSLSPPEAHRGLILSHATEPIPDPNKSRTHTAANPPPASSLSDLEPPLQCTAPSKLAHAVRRRLPNLGPPVQHAAAVEAHLCNASPPSEARASAAGHLLLQCRPATAADRATTERASEREERRGKITTARGPRNRRTTSPPALPHPHRSSLEAVRRAPAGGRLSPQ
jgi:hypothetical protein